MVRLGTSKSPDRPMIVSVDLAEVDAIGHMTSHVVFDVQTRTFAKWAPDTDRYSNDQDVSLRPGTWTPAAAWKNQGQATPEAAVETMLWAAAGGDLSALKNTLALAPDARVERQQIYLQAYLPATEPHLCFS